MGKDKDRKPTKASSSAQAAEFLASRGAQGAGFGGFGGGTPLLPATGGFGFGGAAAARLAPPASTPALTSAGNAGPDAQLSSQLDGEVAQCLRHLSKKDAVTKLKALQALRLLIKSKSAAELSLALQPWIFLYARLCQDPSRTVRCEAAATLGELAGAAGKALAPHVKAIIAPWWLAQFDPHADAAGAARAAFQACFPGKKQHEALRYCTSEILTYLSDQATSNAQQLGDARKDTPEEMEERYERVVSASLLALGTLLQALAPAPTKPPSQPPAAAATDADAPHQPAPSNGTGEPAVEPLQPTEAGTRAGGEAGMAGVAEASPQLAKAWAQVATLLSKPGYIKSNIGSKSPLIRSATYTFVREVAACLRASGAGAGADGGAEGPEVAAWKAAASAEVASSLLGALADKDPGNHGPMWAMLLTYIKVFPDCWASVNIRKMVLPRLSSLLRHGCYGSHTTSWPALLPLMSLMPRAIMEPSPDVPVLLLEATWQGLLDASASKAGRAAGCAAYQEVLHWLLVVVAPEVTALILSPTTSTAGTAPTTAEDQESLESAIEATDMYRTLLLQGSVQANVLPAALGAVAGAPAAAADAAVEVIIGLVKRLAAAAATASTTSTASTTDGVAVAPPAVDALRATQRVLAAGAAAVVRGAAEATGAGAGGAVFERCESLVTALRAVHAETADMVGGAVAAALVAAMQGVGIQGEEEAAAATQLPPAASQLLATLIRTTQQGSGAMMLAPDQAAQAGAGASSLDLPGLLRACKHGAVGGAATKAHVHLLLSWLLGSHSADDWLVAVRELTGLSLEGAVNSNTEPKPAAGESTPSLQLALLLVNSLADSLTSRDIQEDHDADAVQGVQGVPPPPRPWEPALDALAAYLSASDSLTGAAEAAGVATTTGSGAAGAVAKALAMEPSVVLLSALLGAGGSHALLVSPACAQRVAATLCHHAGASAGPALAASITPAGCAALAVARALFAPGPAPAASSRPRSTAAAAAAAAPSARAVFTAAAQELTSLLVLAAQLAWGQSAHAAPAPKPYMPASGDASRAAFRAWCGDGSGSDEEEDAVDGDGAVGEVLVGVEAVAVEMAAATWARGHALRTAAAGLDAPGLTAAVSRLVEALMAWVMDGAGQGVDGRAAMAAGHVQQMAAGGALRQAVISEVLLQLGVQLTRLVPASGAGGASSSRKGKPVLHAGLVTAQLFLSHLVHALGSDAVMAATLNPTGGAFIIQPAGVLLHLVAAESALKQAGTGMTAHLLLSGSACRRGQQQDHVGHMVHVAVAQLLAYLLGMSDAQLGLGVVSEALAVAYNGACQTGAVPAASAAPDLQYSPQVYSSLLLCFLQHLAHGCREGTSRHIASLEQFCASQLLPAALQQQQKAGAGAAAAPQLPPTVLEPVLALVSTSLRSVMSHPAYSTSSLARIAQAYIAASLSQPPVTLDPTPAHVTALRLATACFPTAHHSAVAVVKYGRGVPHVAAAGGGGGGGGSQQEQVSPQAPRAALASTTDEERRQLLQLLRHQAVRHGAVAAAKRFGTATPAPTGPPGPNQVAAAAATSALECAATAYAGGDLQEAEWHTVLSDLQASLSEAVRAVHQAVGQLTTVIKTAAGALMGGSSQSAVTGVVALQLLRQLDHRGLLGQHPAYPQLAEGVSGTLEALQLSPALQSVLQTVHVLLNQLQSSATSRVDTLPAGLVTFQQKYRQQFGEVCEQLLGLLLAVGVAGHLCSAGGARTGDAFWTWVGAMGDTWSAAGTATCSFLELSMKAGGAGLNAASYAALTAADSWLDSTDLALHSVDPMLFLALSCASGAPAEAAGETGEVVGLVGDATGPQAQVRQLLAAAAYTALLHAPSSVTSHLSLPVDDVDGKGELQEYEQGTDVINYLIHNGLHPQLASLVGSPLDTPAPPSAARLTAWAILLSHLTSSGGGAEGASARALRHALGDVTLLVPGLLSALLQWLPLTDYVGGRSPARKAGAAVTETAASVSTAAPDFRSLLRAAGVLGGGDAQTSRVARVLYAGVLHALPASARTWFGDLRDRGTAVAVEAYTAAVVSPQLLAAELQDVQARCEELRGEQFNVRASAALREVVAQLVVEEGSSLELAIKLPPSLPLKPPEVECRRRVGVNDTRMRKWLLSISAFLRTNNRGVADAIAMWRSNVESEFDGVEPCLICYSVVAATNSALPRLQCHTCQVRFHPGCLYKWFKSSGKSACPHCQSPW